LREPGDLRHLPLRKKPIGDSALIEDLDAACVQAARARANQILRDASLDDGDVDPRQCQLARQHQPRRASPGNHNRVVGYRFYPHFATPDSLSSTFGQRFCAMTRVLPQAPQCAID